MASIQAQPTQSSFPWATLARIALAILFILPAVLACSTQLAWPTLNTVALSQQKVSLIGPSTNVGLKNYQALFSDAVFRQAVMFTLQMGLGRLLAVALVPVLLGIVAGQFRPSAQNPVRLLFSLPLALYAPAALAVGWVVASNPLNGPLRSLMPAPLSKPGSAQLMVTLADSLTAFGIACGLGLVVYSAAVKGRGWRQAWKPLLAAWLVSLIAALALGLQTLDWSRIMTNGGPARSTINLSLYQYSVSFANMQFGLGAAIATVTLAVLTILGIAAGLIVVLSGLRLRLSNTTDQPRLMPSGLAVGLLVLLVVIALAAVVAGWWPLIWAGTTGLPALSKLGRQVPIGSAIANTLVPVLPILLIELPIAYAAALAIGGLRPLGRWSELLLLPFSPWLFVTVGPFSLVLYRQINQAKLINTQVALIPPILISIPILFILTLFFKGQQLHWQEARARGETAVNAFFKHLILPSLPLALLLALGAVTLALQEVLWPVLVASRPQNGTLTVLLLQLLGQYGVQQPQVMGVAGLLGLGGFPIAFLILAIAQVLYLNRLALTTSDTV